jgi:chromosomal replication initiation ATPase DnaA
MKDYKYIANYINKTTGINVFDKTRRQDVVEARSLFCYILKNDYKLTLYTIMDIFAQENVKFDYSSVYHNVSIYTKVKEKRNEFEFLRNEILKNLLPKNILISKIESLENIEDIKLITNCVNSVTNGN